MKFEIKSLPRMPAAPTDPGFPRDAEQRSRLAKLVACFGPKLVYIYLPNNELWAGASINKHIGRVEFVDYLANGAKVVTATEWLHRYRAVLNGQPCAARSTRD